MDLASHPHPSRSHRLLKDGIHGEKELAELPNQAHQWQPPVDWIQVLEEHLGGMHPGASGESREQTPGSPTGIT